ncbi:glycoside hydrolase family 3 C-terminal domain-containing protein [Paenibacillus sp. S-38]|uniref:glycoside hydrolase family 3 protein n=1 Tax=Paenibacillus sp. S-38 TaxID=3416710 RepID=UPI003CF0D4C1
MKVILALALMFSFTVPAAANEQTGTSSSSGGQASAPSGYTYPFQNPDLSLDARVKDLLSRLTLEEKVSLLHQYAPAIPRLGIQAFRTGTEALHGVAWLGEATVFPQATGLANTWNTQLLKKIGATVGDEARAFHRKDPAQNGLNVWAPVVDLIRDPRSGRNEEGMGEDPYLTGAMSNAYAAGLKGDHPFYLKTAPTLKHFIGYNNEKDRGSSSSSMDPRNLHEYYLKSFKPAIVSGSALSLMPSYNSVNGRPAILSPLLRSVVKEQWAGDDFFIVSDAYDPTGTVNDHHYVDSYPEALALAIRAGVDSMTDQGSNSGVITGYIREALAQGLLTAADVDEAAANVLRIRFRLGEFDPAGRSPYEIIPESVINSKEHAALALKAAQEQLVLLKNEKGALPLSREKLSRVAVVGPLADQVLSDFYSGTLPYAVSPLQGIREKLPAEKIAFTRGVDRIALKSKATGLYVSASPDASAPLTASAAEPGKNESFDLYDYGWDQFLLRAGANDKYLTNGCCNGAVTNTANAPGTNEWFTYQNYRYERLPDQTYALYNYQAGHWDTGLAGGKYVSVEPAAPHTLVTSKDAVTGDTEKFEPVLVSGGQEEAVKAAAGTGAAIVVVGSQPQLNSRETIDRADLVLPPAQEALIEKVASVNPNTIVVVVSGHPFAIPKVQKNRNVKAILYSSHGGQEEGRAIADALFGDYAPAGRLNQTWYAGVNQLPDIMEYDIIKGERTYQYFEGRPLYPFGHGLTYADFAYGSVRLNKNKADAKDTVKVEVEVTNQSRFRSDEVIQLYVHAEKSRVKRPIKELKAFQRVSFEPNQKRRITFELPVGELAFWDVTRSTEAVEPGTYTLMVGRSSEDIRGTAKLKVDGEDIPHRNLYGATRAENYDDYQGVVLVEDGESGGSAVGTAAAGSWLLFKDVDFRQGARSFRARTSGTAGGSIEVRLGDPQRGRPAATAAVPAGSEGQWTTVTSQVYGARGVQDVYLRFAGEMNVSWFEFEPAGAKPPGRQEESEDGGR